MPAQLQPVSRAQAPSRLTDGAVLVLELFLHVPPALEVLLAVPPVGLLADLLPALLVDALRVADGGSAESDTKLSISVPAALTPRTFSTRISSPSPYFLLSLTQTPASAFWFCLAEGSRSMPALEGSRG